MTERDGDSIIFDFDLTLFDLKLDRAVAVDHLQRATDALGISDLVSSWNSAFRAYVELVDDILLEDPNRDLIKRRLDHAMAAGEYEAYPRVEPCDGVKDMLSYLKRRGFRIGVVSSNSLRMIESTCRRFRVWRFFDSVWGRESYGRSKPAPDKLLGCARQLGGRRACYVGDDPTDMDAAVQANQLGIAIIRVTDRLPTPSPAQLKDRGAKVTIWGVKEIPGVLDEVLGAQGE